MSLADKCSVEQVDDPIMQFVIYKLLYSVHGEAAVMKRAWGRFNRFEVSVHCLIVLAYKIVVQVSI